MGCSFLCTSKSVWIWCCTLRQFVSNNCYRGSLFPLTVDQSQGEDVIYQLELVTLISEPLTDLCLSWSGVVKSAL